MAKIRIMFSRFSAFYSPLIATAAGGFLEADGLEAEFSLAGPGRAGRDGLAEGSLDLIQSAPSASWGPLERSELSDIVHFAQINQQDGFFIAGRRPDPEFAWGKLAGARVLADHGGQPLAMLKYALHRQEVDFASLQAIDAGRAGCHDRRLPPGRGRLRPPPGAGTAAARARRRGPCARLGRRGDRPGRVQQPLRDPPLARDGPGARLRARLRKSRNWVATGPADAIAKAEAPFFPNTRPGGAGAYDRSLPASRLLAGRARDPARRLRGRARRVPAQRPDQPAAIPTRPWSSRRRRNSHRHAAGRSDRRSCADNSRSQPGSLPDPGRAATTIATAAPLIDRAQAPDSAAPDRLPH